MSARRFTITAENGKTAIQAVWNICCQYIAQGKDAEVSVAEFEDTRTKMQNRKMWSMLGDISKKVEWSINGTKRKLDPEDWKDVLTAAMKGEQRIADGVNGGFVILGVKTSKMKVKQMNEFIEILYWFGAQHGVEWTA